MAVLTIGCGSTGAAPGDDSSIKAEIAKFKERCDCHVVVERGDTGAVDALTRDVDGVPHIILKRGADIPVSTIKHELIHALEHCRHFAESVFDAPSGSNDLIKLIALYKQRLVDEYIAYRLVENGDHVPLDPEAYPDPDADDEAIAKGAGSIAIGMLGGEELEKLRKALEGMGGPGDIKANTDAYKALKAKLREALARFLRDNKDCIELIRSF